MDKQREFSPTNRAGARTHRTRYVSAPSEMMSGQYAEIRGVTSLNGFDENQTLRKLAHSEFAEYFLALRPWSFSASLVPVVIGATLAYKKTGSYDVGIFLASCLTTLAVHSAGNVVNLYYDYVKGIDSEQGGRFGNDCGRTSGSGGDGSRTSGGGGGCSRTSGGGGSRTSGGGCGRTSGSGGDGSRTSGGGGGGSWTSGSGGGCSRTGGGVCGRTSGSGGDGSRTSFRDSSDSGDTDARKEAPPGDEACTTFRHRTLVDRRLSPDQVVNFGALLYTLGCAGYAVVQWLSPARLEHLALVYFGGLSSSFLYTGGIGLKYICLGDVLALVTFGPICLLFTYFALVGRPPAWSLVLYAVPLSLSTESILHSNNARNAAADRQAGIVTLAIVLGRSGSYVLYAAVVFGPYPVLLYLALHSSVWFALPLVTVLGALRLEKMYRAGSLRQLPRESAKVSLELGALYALALAMAKPEHLPDW